YGSMIAVPGWRFDHNSNVTGRRSPAANFMKFNTGVIQGLDFDNLATSVIGNPCVIARVDPSYLIIQATNIVTQAGVPTGGASLISGPNGEIRIEGRNVDVSRSGLEVQPV